MAIKATIFEKCEKCGQRDARRIGDYVICGLHRCSKLPPGPAGASRRFYKNEINFVPGNFTAAEYRTELDEAWALIDDLRKKRHAAERAATKAVEDAMRSVYS